MMLTQPSRSILLDSANCPKFSLPNSFCAQVRPAGLGVYLSDRVPVRPQVPSLAPQHNSHNSGTNDDYDDDKVTKI